MKKRKKKKKVYYFKDLQSTTMMKRVNEIIEINFDYYKNNNI